MVEKLGPVGRKAVESFARLCSDMLKCDGIFVNNFITDHRHVCCCKNSEEVTGYRTKPYKLVQVEEQRLLMAGKVRYVRKRIAVCATSITPLRELTCHMGSHSITCHPAEVTFPPLPQPIKASTRFSDPRGMQG